MKEPTVTLGTSKGRRTLDAIDGFDTSIGESTVLNGNISGSSHIVVVGKVEGDCDISGTLVITDSGQWVGKISAKTVVIAGNVQGQIIAEGKIDVLSTARIEGALECATLAIASGAIHEGEVRTVKPHDVTHYDEKRS